MITNLLQNFEDILHGQFLEKWKRVQSETIHNDGNLVVCFTGQRGLGKSSLINMLLDEKFLPAGGSDNSNMLVYIEYGQTVSATIVRASGEKEEISMDDWTKAFEILSADDHVLLTVPLAWLSELTIVDIPPHLIYADAIVYLISNDGPSESDMRKVKNLAVGGKRLWIAISQWDVVEDKQKRLSVPLPDVHTWEEQIAQSIGAQVPVVPTSSTGIGKYSLIMFLESLVENKAAIRQERFQNVAIQLINDAFCDMFYQTKDNQQVISQLQKTQSDNSKEIKMLEALNDQLTENARKENSKLSELKVENNKLKISNSQIKEMMNYFEEGEICFVKEDYDKAIENFNKAISLNRNCAKFYDRCGCTFFAKKDYDKALENMDKAISLNQNDAYFYFGRGRAYHEKEDYDKATENYNKAVSLNPADEYSYYWRGCAFLEKEDYDKALESLDKAISLNQNDANFYFERGKAYDLKKDNDKAVENYNHAIRLNPNKAIYYHWLGWAYNTKGEYDIAIENFCKAINLNPNDAGFHFACGLAYHKKNENNSALSEFHRAVNLNPNDANFYYWRANAYYNLGIKLESGFFSDKIKVVNVESLKNAMKDFDIANNLGFKDAQDGNVKIKQLLEKGFIKL
jgi:tetratricopeptide (TPR) repeat protein